MGSTRCRSEVKKGEIFGILQESESELTIKECGHEDTSYIKKKSFILFTSTENEHYEQILKMTMCNSRLIKEQFSIHLQLMFPAMFDIKYIFFQKVTVTEILKNKSKYFDSEVLIISKCFIKLKLMFIRFCTM